jgi:hypothetical protein
MTRPHTYLIRMLLFLAAVAGLTGMLFDKLAVAFANNPPLNGLIAAVLLAGIIWNLRQVIRLGPEVRWIEIFRLTPERAATAPPPTLLAPMASMLVARVDGHENRRLTLSAAIVRGMLDSLSSRLDESRELSRYTTGLLIFLGLLGTFWGLLLTVSSVSDVIGSLSVGSGDINAMFEQLKSGLARPLHGMGTAFSSSMFGLSGALVLSRSHRGPGAEPLFQRAGGMARCAHPRLRWRAGRGRGANPGLRAGAARTDGGKPRSPATHHQPW